MRKHVALSLFMLLVVGGGLAIGALTRPDDWYRALAKPPFNPPDWVFAPVWTALYAAIAVAGWRTWRRGRDRAGMALWWGQLALNFAWTPLFFGAHRIDLALATIVVLLAAILGFIAWTAARDRISALLFVPYAVWVGFATILTTALFARNS